MSGTLQIKTARVFLPLLQPARYKGAYGGRGGAKSHFFAEMLLETCLLRPTRAVCIREVQKSLDQSVKQLLEDKIQTLRVGSYFDVKQTHIEGPHDGLILFQGMQNHTAESIKSLEGIDVAWVEEAQSLSQRSLDLLIPTIRKPASEIWFSWNPRYESDPVDVLLRGETPPTNAVVVKTTYQDNPWFPSVLLQDIEREKARDYESFEHIWLGDYERHAEARVFKQWRKALFETPEKAHFYFGADWGFSEDPTVLVRCYVTGRTLYVDREVYQTKCDIDHTPALFDSLDPSDRGMARRWPIVADSARPETISYLQRHGYPKIVAAKKGPHSVEDGIAFLQSYDIVVHERCIHTIRELGRYAYERDKQTNKITPYLEDDNNHVIDALRYAAESLRLIKPSVAVILANKGR